MVDGSRLNLNCKFNSSPQKVVLLNILIGFIFTTLLLKLGQRPFRMGAGLGYFTEKGCFFDVTSCRQCRDSFF